MPWFCNSKESAELPVKMNISGDISGVTLSVAMSSNPKASFFSGYISFLPCISFLSRKMKSPLTSDISGNSIVSGEDQSQGQDQSQSQVDISGVSLLVNALDVILDEIDEKGMKLRSILQSGSESVQVPEVAEALEVAKAPEVAEALEPAKAPEVAEALEAAKALEPAKALEQVLESAANAEQVQVNPTQASS
jgi:hypothetical protein